MTNLAVRDPGLFGGPADASGATKSGARAKTVTMKSLSFDPEKLEVHVRDSVESARREAGVGCERKD